MLKSFKSGFTLAEVLITLGIIGVVAAMTMPTLMNSTNGAQYRTAYKKALSVLSQAVVLNVALDDFDLSQTTANASGATNDASVYALFMNRMNVVKTADSNSREDWTASNDNTVKFGKSATTNYTLFFNDGITFTFPNDVAACTAGNATTPGNICEGVIDVNGAKNPNRLVTCDGTTNSWNSAVDACTVTNPTDMYPVKFYDQSILPSTDAAEAVLYGGK